VGWKGRAVLGMGMGIGVGHCALRIGVLWIWADA